MPGLDELNAPNYTDFLNAAARTARGVAGGRKEGRSTRMLENFVPGTLGVLGGALGNLATLPSRALSAAGDLQRTGEYDPGPAVETMMLGPGISLPKALLGKGIDPSSLAALYLKPKGRSREFAGLKSDMFEMINDQGQSVGSMRTAYNPTNKDVHVEGIYSNKNSPLKPGLATESNYASHSLGAKDIRSLLVGIRKEFPEAQTVSGYRISGGREAAGTVDRIQSIEGLSSNAQMRLPQFSDKHMQSYEIGLANQEANRARLTGLNAEYQRITSARRARDEAAYLQRQNERGPTGIQSPPTNYTPEVY